MFNAKWSRKKNLAFLAVIFTGLLLWGLFFHGGGADDGRLVFHSEGYLTLQNSDGSVTDISYRDLVSVEFCEVFDFGAPVAGGVEDGVREGLWRSDAVGDYIASSSVEIECCVLLRTADTLYALNYESAGATRAIYEALSEAAEGGPSGKDDQRIY